MQQPCSEAQVKMAKIAQFASKCSPDIVAIPTQPTENVIHGNRKMLESFDILSWMKLVSEHLLFFLKKVDFKLLAVHQENHGHITAVFIDY